MHVLHCQRWRQGQGLLQSIAARLLTSRAVLILRCQGLWPDGVRRQASGIIFRGSYQGPRALQVQHWEGPA